MNTNPIFVPGARRTFSVLVGTVILISLAACGGESDVPVTAGIVQVGSTAAEAAVEEVFDEAAAVDDGLGSTAMVAALGSTPETTQIFGPFDLVCAHANERECAAVSDQKDRMPSQLPEVANAGSSDVVDTIPALIRVVADIAEATNGPLSVTATVAAWQVSPTATLDGVDITTPAVRAVTLEAFIERGFDPASLDLDDGDRIVIRLEPWGPTAMSSAAMNDFAALMRELWARSAADVVVTTA